MPMTSTAFSSYPEASRDFLVSAKRRPEMFFRTLSELEAVMYGHGVAFQQLGLLADSSDTFNVRFEQWLEERKRCSVSAGWGVAIEELAQPADVDSVGLFFDLNDEFTHQCAIEESS